MKDLCFITSVFGERYSRFLLPHVKSIRKHHDCDIKIFHSQDVPKHILDECKNCELIEVDVPQFKHKHQIINEGVKCRCQGSNIDARVVLVDIDVLFVKNIEKFFQEDAITLTFRDNHLYPINGGVILLNNGCQFHDFTKRFETRTFQIHEDRVTRIKSKEQYGSSDQQALMEIKNDYKINAVACRDLNEVDCNFDERTHAFHYKTGWHPFLLDDMPFPKKGPRTRCYKAYEYWLSLQEN